MANNLRDVLPELVAADVVDVVAKLSAATLQFFNEQPLPTVEATLVPAIQYNWQVLKPGAVSAIDPNDIIRSTNYLERNPDRQETIILANPNWSLA
jgi:hypothetical protein